MPQSYPSPSSMSRGLYDPPSPHSRDPNHPHMDQAIPVPGGSPYGLLNAIAGPSSDRGPRRESAETDVSGAPFSPSSAPATPSATGTTHPPEYIHTHLPRRGSMTPLGLNVISPRAPVSFPYGGTTPTQTFQPSFTMQRSVGFNPTGVPQGDHSPTVGSSNSLRRSSVASTSSTLTQSRPIQPAPNRDRRRSSLTPIHPTLAPPSPSRHVAKGRHSRPSSSDGPSSGSSPLHSRTRTEPPSKTIGAIARDDFKEAVGEFGRRGSMPHLAYGSGSARGWNPSLPPPRGSVGDEELMPEEGFKFGSIPAGPSSPAAAALRAIDASPGSRRSSFLSGGAGRGDVFAEAEAEEAEKQRRAFIAATYGVDGKRARERLSIGGPSLAAPAGSSPTSRRPSLMLWEKLGMQAAQRAAGPLDVGSASAPTLPTLSYAVPFDELEFGQRRGSLPIAIPGGTLGRSMSKREAKEARIHDMDAPIIVTDTDAELEDESEDEEELPEVDDFGRKLTPPVRPLPPLLPLSDPGPRLLPSTLALHRASHLLNARNLQPEPLPHPLPPSLHPPAPVDLAEFDIDFILAGSQAQLGGDKKGKNTQIDTLASPRMDAPTTPTLRLGSGGEDDTFAKFVGQFDDEYGDRRGEWTFRSSTMCSSHEELRDPLDASASREGIKAEWESLGAGKYELYGNGEVRSAKSGSVWRVKKIGGREYELEQVKKGLTSRSPELGDAKTPAIAASETFFLAGKSQHCECGGVKFTTTIRLPRQAASRANSGSLPAPRAAQIRASISDASPRADRIGSADSSRAAMSTSAPLSSAIQAMMPKKKRTDSHSASKDLEEERGRPSVSFLQRPDGKKPQERSPSRERDKKKGGFGGVLKRGLASIKHGHADEKKAAKEEKERERMQSQSWSGAGPSHRDHPTWMHPSGRTNSSAHGVHGAQQFFSHPSSGSQRKSSTSVQTGTLTPSQSSLDEREKRYGTPRSEDQDRGSEVLLADDEVARREGKGWSGVPEDAVAMVIPIESEGQNGPAGMISHHAHGTITPNADGHRQALLVWFVPFNSDIDRPALSTIASSSSSSRDTLSSTPETSNQSSSSIPKFQKLLRRRASKEKDGLKLSAPTSSSALPATRPQPHVSFGSDPNSRQLPLPFRSFRIVARAVDWEELRSDTTPSSTQSPVVGFNQWAEHNPPSRSNTGTSTASSQLPSPNLPHDILPTDESSAAGSTSTAPTSTVGTGRNFPTVIAVCHSRTQGVEFVLEGLDRLGFCQGESAWGPTGYEEWRGSGLSEKGRELLDLLWAGCVAVLGIAA